MLILYKPFICQNLFGISIPFSQQVVPDPHTDSQPLNRVFNYYNSTNNYTNCLFAYDHHALKSPPDIGEINYLSDGKTLNATIWLNSVFETPPPAIVYNSNSSSSNFNDYGNLFSIAITNSSTAHPNLIDYVHNRIDNLKQTLANLSIISQNRSTIGDNISYLIKYSYKRNDQNVVANKLWLSSGNKIYTITIISNQYLYQTYLPIFEKMIKSFKILSSKDALLNNDSENSGYKTYRNPLVGIEIGYPKEWKERQLTDGKQTTVITFVPGENQFIKDGRTFVMDIDINSPYDLQGIDYRESISWNPSAQTWIKELDEARSIPMQNKIINPSEEKVLELDNNYSGFYDEEKNYAQMSLNLTKLNFPDQYNLDFYVFDTYYDKDSSCGLVDLVDRVHVPPPEFDISTVPDSIVLRQGEEKNMELQVKNINTKLTSHVLLSTYSSNGTKVKFIPNQVSIPPYGITTTLVNIKAADNATIRPYSFPIIANITFPTSRDNYLSNETLYNKESANIIKRSVFTATVLERIPLDQQLNNFLTSWFNPITGAYSTIITIITGILGWKIWKRKGKENK